MSSKKSQHYFENQNQVNMKNIGLRHLITFEIVTVEEKLEYQEALVNFHHCHGTVLGIFRQVFFVQTVPQ